MTLDHNSIAKKLNSVSVPFSVKINPTAMYRDQTYSTFDLEILKEMGRLGLIGFSAAKSIGGQGRTWEE